MYTKSQIANIAKLLILPAKHHLSSLTEDIEIEVESVGEGTFLDTKIGCVTRGFTLVINSDWFTSVDNQDIKYIIWHEIRHMYQLQQTKQLVGYQPCCESISVVNQWLYEWNNYIPNTVETETEHFKQHIEIDAYAFALAMLFLYMPNPDGSVDIGLPPVIEAEVFEKAQQLVKVMQRAQYYRNTIERNADCPCGSGRKYKKCCRQQGLLEL